MRTKLANLLGLVTLLFTIQGHTATTNPLLQLNTGGLTAANRALILTADESLLISGGDGKVVRVWDTRTNQQVRQIRGEVSEDINGAIMSMGLSPDNRLLAVGVFYPHQSEGKEKRGFIRIHDFASGELIRTLKGHVQVARALVFSPDSSMLLASEASAYSPEAIIWDTSNWQVTKRFKGHDHQIYGAAFTPDGSRVVTASWDKSIRIWDVQSAKLVKKVSGAHDGRIYNVVIPRGASEPIAVSGGTDKTVRIWNYQTGKKIRTVKLKRKVRQLTTNHQGTRIFASSVGFHADAWIDVIDASSGKVISTYGGHDFTTMAMAVSRDGDTVYSSGGYQNQIHKWSASSNQQILSIAGAGQPVESVAISADNNEIYWGHQQLNWNGKKYNPDVYAPLERKIELNTIHNQLGVPQTMTRSNEKPARAIHKLGKLKIERTREKSNGFLNVLKIKKGSSTIGKITRSNREGYMHTAYSFTPDGKAVVSGAESGYLSIYSIKGKKIGDFEGHHDDITDVSISKDGTRLVSSSRDQTFKLWNMETREMLLSFFIAQNGEWIAWTATGHYTSSPNGDRYIGWVINQGFDRNAQYVVADQMKKQLYRPDIVQKVLGNLSLTTALQSSPQATFNVAQVQAKKVIPVNFDVLSPQQGHVTDDEAINLKVQVTENIDSDIDWSVTVNQRQILNPSATRGLARTQPAGKTLTFPVILDPGQNEIRIVADNNETQKEINLVVTRNVTTMASKGVAGDKLLMISIGVDEYVHLPEHNLRFAAADADRMAEIFVAQQGKNYDSVKSIILSDNQQNRATRDNVIDALDAMADLGPNDTVVLFMAGHGVIEDEEYFFLPRDAALRNEDRWKKSTVIAWSEIQRAMQSTLGRRILLVDTCHAESAFNSRLVKDAEDSDIIVMSSTDSATLAQEITSLGHGVFTYALAQGIEGKADSFKDGRVTMTELNAYVANAVPSITQNAQIPTLSVPGGFQDFVIASL